MSTIYTSLPLDALATDIDSENQTEEVVQTPENEPNPEDNAVENVVEAVEPIMPAIMSDGVEFDVTVAKSLDGTRPADGAFAESDSIDLANVTRYDMFYTYLKIDYKNNSGEDLTGTNITMQMPKINEPNYYEPIQKSSVPTSYVKYPNTQIPLVWMEMYLFLLQG